MAARALITGASGLIGTHVCHEWEVPDLEPLRLDRHVDDLLTPGAARAVVSRVRPTVVIHLAWVASGTPDYRTSPDNARWVDASLELREACRDFGSRLVVAGTSVDSETNPVDAYCASKVNLRRLFEDDIQSGELTWIRPYYVFDPDRRRPALVDHAITAAATGRVLALRTPHSRHDFIHAADVGRAVVLAVREKLTGEISVGSGKLRSVSELVTALGAEWLQEAGPSPAARHHHEAAEIGRLVDLGWSPTYTEELFSGE